MGIRFGIREKRCTLAIMCLRIEVMLTWVAFGCDPFRSELGLRRSAGGLVAWRVGGFAMVGLFEQSEWFEGIIALFEWVY